jgi:hypothetical protein
VDGYGGCLLPFVDESRPFVLGFEAGRAWAELMAEPEESASFTMHEDNAELFVRMAEALGRPFRAETLGDGWMEFEFGAADVVA